MLNGSLLGLSGQWVADEYGRWADWAQMAGHAFRRRGYFK